MMKLRHIFQMLFVLSLAWITPAYSEGCWYTLCTSSNLTNHDISVECSPDDPTTNCPCSTADVIIYGVLAGGLSLDNKPPHYYLDREYKAGVRMHAVNIGWVNMEPAQGKWNTAYIKEKRAEIAMLRDKGFLIVLEPGISNAPEWIRKSGPGMKGHPFVDQYGNESSRYPNGIWSDSVRECIAAYIRKILSPDVFGQDIFAFRLGSACHVETLYPDPLDGVPNNQFEYWGFDSLALKHMAKVSPWLYEQYTSGAWKPGGKSNPVSPDGRLAADIFYNDHYIGRMVDTVNWQIGTIRDMGYKGILIQLCPGMGIVGRPDADGWNGYSGLVKGNLMPDRGWGYGAPFSGAAWDRIVGGIRPENKKKLVVECSSFGENQPGLIEDGPDPLKWSSGHWLAYVADQAGLPKWGENPGFADDLKTMDRAFALMEKHNYTGLCWAFESLLFPPDPKTNPDHRPGIGPFSTIDDYAAHIREASQAPSDTR